MHRTWIRLPGYANAGARVSKSTEVDSHARWVKHLTKWQTNSLFIDIMCFYKSLYLSPNCKLDSTQCYYTKTWTISKLVSLNLINHYSFDFYLLSNPLLSLNDIRKWFNLLHDTRSKPGNRKKSVLDLTFSKCIK